MQVLAKLLVCALALAAVTTDAADTIRKGCDDAGADLTPLPTTGKPDQTTPAPTTGKPDQTTPAPTTGKPDPTTPAPTTTTPAPTTTTPAPATTTPAPVTTTPAPVTTTPAPVTTTPAPVTTTPAPAPGTFDPKKEYLVDGVTCNGFLRLPQPGKELIQDNCQVGFSVKFTSADETPTKGCVVCENGRPFVYDGSVELSKQSVPLCGGLPLCTRFGGYFEVTEYDLMCVLSVNGAAPVDDAKVCGLGDN